MANQFSHKDVNVLTRTVNYAGFLRLETLLLQHAMFNGGMSAEIRRELLVRGEAVGVLPYDPRRDEVLLIEQFRPGVCKSEHSPWMLEIVAGLVEEGESYAEVAARESEEEAGCQVTKLEPIVGYYSSPGFTDEYLMLYCGQVDTSAAGGVFGLATEHEDIRAAVYSADECFERLARGEIINASTVIALQWLQLNRERIRKEACVNG
jgi:ADP-ribose pyrophosphatase